MQHDGEVSHAIRLSLSLRVGRERHFFSSVQRGRERERGEQEGKKVLLWMWRPREAKGRGLPSVQDHNHPSHLCTCHPVLQKTQSCVCSCIESLTQRFFSLSWNTKVMLPRRQVGREIASSLWLCLVAYVLPSYSALVRREVAFQALLV